MDSTDLSTGLASKLDPTCRPGLSARQFRRLFGLAVLFLGATISLVAQSLGGFEVLSPTGQPLPGVRVQLWSGQRTLVFEALTGADGRVGSGALPRGDYQLRLEHPAYGTQTRPFSIGGERELIRSIQMSESSPVLSDQVTVTSTRGIVEDLASSPNLVVVRERGEQEFLPPPTIGHALEAAPGILLQQSTYGQVSPFLRGLTGYQVLNLVDGIRFNNSTFRSGPNQYLTLVEPSQVQRLEVMLGPVSSQYGSDGLGGAINLLTDSPRFRAGSGAGINGQVALNGATADLSSGVEARLTGGNGWLAWLGGVSARRHGDLRPGGGRDSRHVLRRFLGLDQGLIRELVGSRLQDTGFGATGWHGKLAFRLPLNQFLTIRYQQAELTNIRAYKDLQGGLGRLRSDVEPQVLNLLYARYERLGWGPFDSVTGSVSLNAQQDGSARQGLRSIDLVIRDRNRVDSIGYIGQVTSHLGTRNAIVGGGEVYDERIDADRDETDPLTGRVAQRRALYPNGSRYVTSGLFVRNTLDVLRKPDRSRLRAVVGVRYSRVDYRTRADRNRDATGRDLGVVDSQLNFGDVTWDTSLNWQVTEEFSLFALAARGFRAPNLNDIGALGLNDLGYEVPALSAVGLGGLIGTSDGEGVGTSGRPVSPLRAERLLNYESGFVLRNERFTLRANIFQATLTDPIVRRTLLFPVDRVPTSLSGTPVTPLPQTSLQRAQNVVGVATALDPRAIKSFLNEGRIVYYGIETNLRYVLTRGIAVDGSYSYLVGREVNPNRFVRRLPPQQGAATLHVQPAGRFWFDLTGLFSGRQERLSGGDLSDERIGAARRRRDVTDFLTGAMIRPFMLPGADGRPGTLDDLFGPTGETITAIRDRLLPLGRVINGVTVADDSTRIPLYPATHGFAVLHLSGGINLRDGLTLQFALRNLFDRNYRLHGSGIDEPGINGQVGLRISF